MIKFLSAFFNKINNNTCKDDQCSDNVDDRIKVNYDVDIQCEKDIDCFLEEYEKNEKNYILEDEIKNHELKSSEGESIKIPSIKTSDFLNMDEPSTISGYLDQIIEQAEKLKEMTCNEYCSEVTNGNEDIMEWLSHVLTELNGQSESKFGHNKGYVKMIEGYNQYLESEIKEKNKSYLKAKEICENIVYENIAAKMAVISNHSASSVCMEVIKNFVRNDNKYNLSILNKTQSSLHKALKNNNKSIKDLALMHESEILALSGISYGYLAIIKEAFKSNELFAICNLDKQLTYNNVSFLSLKEHYSKYSDFRMDKFTWLAPSIYYGENKAIKGYDFKKGGAYVVSLDEDSDYFDSRFTLPNEIRNMGVELEDMLKNLNLK